MRYRIEKDEIGELQLPAEAYYGIYTARSANNFAITKRGINRQMIKALTIVKKSAAKANMDAGELDSNIAEAIMSSCDEILNGRLHGQFITDLIQGGAGSGMNMNANEVIANRANEMLGGRKGTYEYVHPLKHVNCGQSTNDVVPTAARIAITKQIKKLQVELKKLQNSFISKSKEYEHLSRNGRTHLQIASPINLGTEFLACASVLGRDLKRLDLALTSLSEVNMGGTSIGTSLNAHPKYLKKIVFYINKYSGEEFVPAKDLIDKTRNLDAFAFTSSVLKVLATNLSKIASDLRLLASDGSNGFNEINLPNVEMGSSTMPGCFNPVIPEVINQISFYVYGLDTTITKACESGQLEINVFSPIIYMSLFEQITSLRRGIRTLREKAIDGLTVNEKIILE